MRSAFRARHVISFRAHQCSSVIGDERVDRFLYKRISVGQFGSNLSTFIVVLLLAICRCAAAAIGAILSPVSGRSSFWILEW